MRWLSCDAFRMANTNVCFAQSLTDEHLDEIADAGRRAHEWHMNSLKNSCSEDGE